MLNFNTRVRESVREEERGEKIQPAKKKKKDALLCLKPVFPQFWKIRESKQEL